MNATKFLEIETKYKADDIKLSDFRKLMFSLEPLRELEAGSYDHYYEKQEDLFIRYRQGTNSQLTMKSKSKDSNNYIRTELNLPLDPAVNSLDMHQIVDKFCDMLGFKLNFAIWKDYFVYFWDGYNVVYYVVYDEEHREKGRFIEIEMDEHRAWASEEEAWNLLGQIELALAPLGVSASKRTRLSLYERFRKNVNASPT